MFRLIESHFRVHPNEVNDVTESYVRLGSGITTPAIVLHDI